MSNYCICTPDKNRGWTLNPLSGMWVCSMCALPSKATYEIENSDVICDICGYPDWWTDNDCPACGGMDWDSSLDNVASN